MVSEHRLESLLVKAIQTQPPYTNNQHNAMMANFYTIPPYYTHSLLCDTHTSTLEESTPCKDIFILKQHNDEVCNMIYTVII